MPGNPGDLGCRFQAWPDLQLIEPRSDQGRATAMLRRFARQAGPDGNAETADFMLLFSPGRAPRLELFSDITLDEVSHKAKRARLIVDGREVSPPIALSEEVIRTVAVPGDPETLAAQLLAARSVEFVMDDAKGKEMRRFAFDVSDIRSIPAVLEAVHWRCGAA